MKKYNKEELKKYTYTVDTQVAYECNLCGYYGEGDDDYCEECGSYDVNSVTYHEDNKCENCNRQFDQWEDVYENNNHMMCDVCYEKLEKEQWND